MFSIIMNNVNIINKIKEIIFEKHYENTGLSFIMVSLIFIVFMNYDCKPQPPENGFLHAKFTFSYVLSSKC